jgi:hypothetical protein
MFLLSSYHLRLIQAEIGSIVPLGRAIFLMIPGTSCLATTVLSLPDKTIRPSKIVEFGAN